MCGAADFCGWDFFFFLFWMCVLCRGCFCVRDHVSCRRQDVYFAPQKKKPKTFAKKKRRVARRLLGEEERRKKKTKKGARRTRHQRLTGRGDACIAHKKAPKEKKATQTKRSTHTGKTWVPGERKKASKRRLN